MLKRIATAVVLIPIVLVLVLRAPVLVLAVVAGVVALLTIHEFLKLTETFERPEYDTLRYIATIDDPGAYTKPWSGGWAIPWNPNDEMYEYVCQENNRDARHMYRGEQ